MGLFDDEQILPGVATEILPNTLDTDNSDYGSTDSVTIIGTAFNGPVGDPQQIGSPEMAEYLFGSSFDPETKREASLVAELKDAYDRGCRNLYAVRVSGKEMYKDYELAIETNLKLRVSGYFPYNGNKECFMTYEMRQGSDKAFGVDEGVIRIYKPANRTVISEKLAGVVDDINSTLVTEIILDSEGFSKDSRLCDVLDTVNKKVTNNVLKFDLVDANGVKKTNASKEVQEIPVAALFPGIYTLCRDKAGKMVTELTDIEIVRANLEEKKNVLYPDSDSLVWKRLKANTNPTKPYPIYAEEITKFQNFLGLGYTITNHFDFLKTHKEIDKVAIVDKIDYEEVELDGLELYKRLGSGYLRTACLKEVGKTQEGGKDVIKYKVAPAPDGDNKRVVSIEDGIYSKLQMHETDYVVLAATTAETDITGKLPKKSEFAISKTVGYELSVDDTSYLTVSAKTDSKDIKSDRVKYDVHVEYANPQTFPKTKDVISALSDKKVMRMPSLATLPITKFKGVADGQLAYCLADNKVYKMKDGTFTVVPETLIENSTLILTQTVETTGEKESEVKTFDLGLFKKSGDAYTVATKDDLKGEGGADKTYFVAMADAKANVYKVEGDKFVPFVSLKDIANSLLDEEDFMTSFAEPDMPILTKDNDNLTYVRVYSTDMEYNIIEELVDELNECQGLKDRFLFGFVSEKAQDDSPHEVGQAITGQAYNKEKEIDYDLNLHIPYTTTDNFARHLAQHCMFTTYKSYPCHGIIGCDKLNGVSLSTISSRVEEICSLDLDMFAKKSNGNNILNSDNSPIPVGSCVSVVFAQYPVATGSGYDYTSSGASGYAGLISTLPADRSTTNQVINIDNTNLMFNLSNYQLTKLNSAGIVCLKRVGNDIVVVDGITQAPADSAYRRLSTAKAVNTVAKLLREAIQPFIGSQQTLATMNSLETKVKSVLKSVVNVLITDFDFSIKTDTQTNLLGVVEIAYAIVPAAEIKFVRNTITIK